MLKIAPFVFIAEMYLIPTSWSRPAEGRGRGRTEKGEGSRDITTDKTGFTWMGWDRVALEVGE